MKPKHQRLALALIALAALIGAALLAASELSDKAAYFYAPSELSNADPARAIRLGGMVKEDSIERDDGGVTFIVTDGKGEVEVRYRGITPDLFVEGSGVVAEGRLQADGRFQAESLLARHDENYVPRELDGMMEAGERDSMRETLIR